MECFVNHTCSEPWKMTRLIPFEDDALCKQTIIAQQDRDASIVALVVGLQDLFGFLQSAETIQKIESYKQLANHTNPLTAQFPGDVTSQVQILKHIAQQTTE